MATAKLVEKSLDSYLKRTEKKGDNILEKEGNILEIGGNL